MKIAHPFMGGSRLPFERSPGGTTDLCAAGKLLPRGNPETMSHSYTSCLVHYVFSTKERRKSISPEIRERLWAYLGGIARENGMRALAVGGTDDHVHMLVSLPSTLSIAKAVQFIKGGSSKWMHETFPSMGAFAWQEGYGGIFGVRFRGGEYDRLHPGSGGTSSNSVVRGRVSGLSESTWNRVRSSLCPRLRFDRP